MASFTVLAAASFFPEYVRARLSAGLMFHMKDLKPTIDNLSESGSHEVELVFVRSYRIYIGTMIRSYCYKLLLWALVPVKYTAQ